MGTSVLFVCLGNICRSPTAHAVFRDRVAQSGLADSIRVDSAGTGDWHLGEAPDRRATAAALRRGYRMHELRARQVTPGDFSRFDYVMAMDRSNLANLQRLRQADQGGELELFLRYCRRPGPEEVPDPYYGGDQGFEQVLDLIEDAADGLLEHVRQRL